MISIDEIREAENRLTGVIHKTELIFSKTFSEISGSNIYLKTENLQKTGSFKVRGAYYKISKLSEEDKQKGVVAVSAGNHAQGVALAASLLGIKAVIVMPEFAPMAKIIATKNYGAEVILHGKNLEQAREEALRIAAEGKVLIHPYDDHDIITGQGTIGLEMLGDLPEIDTIIVPVGGGGLISGIAVAAKALKPEIRIIGVEVEGFDALKLSMERNMKVDVTARYTMADGIAVGQLGNLTYSIMKEMVDEVVVVSNDEVSSAILWLLERTKLVVEGAGAVGVAAVLAKKASLGQNTGILLSGGNIDLSMLQLIIDKGLIKEGRRVELKVLIPDKPGQLKGVLELLSSLGVNIYSIMHERVREGISPGYAEIDMVLETRDAEHADEVIEKLRTAGYEVR